MNALALIAPCVMECYFREHVVERNPLFHDPASTHLAVYPADRGTTKLRDYLTRLHQTLKFPSHAIRTRLLRLTTDSTGLIATIKQEVLF